MIIKRSDQDWLRLLNELKVSHKLDTLAGLADKLCVSQSMISHLMAKRRKLPMACKIRLLDALGYTIDRGELAGMMPENAQKALSEIERLKSEEGFMEAWGD